MRAARDVVGSLVELGLIVRPKARKSSEGQQLRAREIASVAIDSMTDSSAHPSDQDGRKRRLLEGSEEFRDVRVDRSTAKRKWPGLFSRYLSRNDLQRLIAARP
jgi:hypothetical protein